MLKCAKCNDFLDGHKCNTCSLMHRCLRKTCGCQIYENLPVALGSSGRLSYGDNGHPTHLKGFYAVNKEVRFTNAWRKKNRNRWHSVVRQYTQEKLERGDL